MRQPAVGESTVILTFNEDVRSSGTWRSVLGTAFLLSIDSIAGSVDVELSQYDGRRRRRLLQGMPTLIRVDFVAKALFASELAEAEAASLFESQMESAVTTGALDAAIATAADQWRVPPGAFVSVDVEASLPFIGDSTTVSLAKTTVSLGEVSSKGTDDDDKKDAGLSAHAFVVIILFVVIVVIALAAAFLYFAGDAHQQRTEEKQQQDLEKMEARELWATRLHARLSTRRAARICTESEEEDDDATREEIPQAIQESPALYGGVESPSQGELWPTEESPPTYESATMKKLFVAQRNQKKLKKSSAPQQRESDIESSSRGRDASEKTNHDSWPREK